MNYSTPKIFAISSTDTYIPPQIPLRLYNIKFVAIKSNMNLKFQAFDKHGNELANLTFNSGVEIKYEYLSSQKFVFSDPNSYLIYVIQQSIDFNTVQDYELAKANSDVSIIPVSNVIITSPLDSNGNVKVDLETPLPTGSNNIGYVNADITSPLDANGNVKVNLETPLPAGTNNIGYIYSVKPTKNAVLLNNASLTANTTWTYSPQSNKITILIHITSVSGTNPTLNVYVYAVDPAGNVLSGDAVASSSQFTTAGDQFINIDLYGVQEIQISAVLGGTSPSFTGTISVEG